MCYNRKFYIYFLPDIHIGIIPNLKNIKILKNFVYHLKKLFFLLKAKLISNNFLFFFQAVWVKMLETNILHFFLYRKKKSLW